MPNLALSHGHRLAAIALAAIATCAGAQVSPSSAPSAASSTAAAEDSNTLGEVTVSASADASAEGLSRPFSGGQVARGGRVGILGNKDLMETPFQTTSYTQELIADQQAHSVADVLQNAPSIRQARGFGNFQELYVVRGFALYSDDIAYNGLYGMLPRQYVASQFFERVEVLLGANAFLNGAAPGGSGIGGGINLLPKRAGNEAINQVTAGYQSSSQAFASADFSRRFGPDNSTGIRLNLARRNGGTGVDHEKRELTMGSLGLDWHSRNVRLSADLGYQDNQLRAGRPNVSPSGFIPEVPGRKVNYAQPWTYSEEKDLFGTVRAEWDINEQITAWAAGGIRSGKERNSLTGFTPTAVNGDGTYYRFDNHRKDSISTAEVGLRGKFQTGAVGHQVTASAMVYDAEEKNAWGMSGNVANNLYNPWATAIPAYLYTGGDLSNPNRVGDTKTRSFALADTVSMFDDKLQVTLGLRHQTLEQTTYAYGSGEQTDHYKKSRVTPVAGIVYRFTPQLSVYGNYIEGLARGEVAPLQTSSGAPVLNAGQVFTPYRSKQKEIGAKWEQDSWGASAALFTSDRPISFIQNQVFGQYGTQRNQGLELSVYGQPVKGLRLLGGVTFLDAKQRRTEGGLTDGKQFIGVPKQQLSLGADWDVPGVSGLALNGRLSYTGSQFADAANTMKVDSWTRVDLGARYLVPLSNNRLLTLRGRIDNLFGKNYWASVGGFPGSNYLVQAAPRSVVLSATMDF